MLRIAGGLYCCLMMHAYRKFKAQLKLAGLLNSFGQANYATFKLALVC